MMDSFFDIPGLDPTDAFSSAFADDLLGGDVFGLNGGIGGGSLLGLDMDMMDPFGGPGSSSSSLLSDVFNSPTSTSGSDYGSSMSSFSAATMEDTLCEADLFQSFASAKNFAARNKVRLNNAMKARNGGGGAVRNTHNNSHHTHNNNTYKKYGKHGGSRPTISMGGNNNGGGGGSSVHPKVYISTFSHNKRNGAGGGGSSSGAGSGTSILLKSKRGNGGSGGSRNGRGGGGGSSLISSKMSTTITSHHHQPRRSGMYGHVQQQQLQQQQQYQQRQPKQIPKTIKFNRSAGSGSSYQLPGSSSISKGNVFPQKNGSCKSKNSSSHSSINNNGRNNNSGAANRSSFQVAAAAAAQVQQTKVVPIPNPSADHDYCVVYTEAMFATSSTAASSNNSSDHLNSNLDDILISSSQSSNSCPNVDSFLNDHLFSLGSPSAMLNDTIVNSIDGSGGSGDTHMKKGQQSSTEVANDLEDLLDGFIPDDVLLNELPNCLQDLFDLDLNSLMDVKSEDVLDGLNDGKQLVVITPLFS